ncbi:MAG: hypothetical protein ACRC39_01635 [Enterobacter sp.]
MDFSRPIGYLEYNDFNTDGDLKLNLPSFKIPGIFIMIQGSYCGACTRAKPSFQQLANQGLVQCMTIQLDGERQTERDVGKILNKIYPNMKGVPSYVYYKNSNTKIFYDGDRTVDDMKKFIYNHNTL